MIISHYVRKINIVFLTKFNKCYNIKQMSENNLKLSQSTDICVLMKGDKNDT